MRLVVGGLEEPACKINMLVQTAAELYYRYDNAKATQLVYCELSTPKAQKQKECKKETTTDPIAGDDSAQEQLDKGFVYHEIREKLTRLGIPREQIAFIQDHNTRPRRAALFAAMNRGDIRILIASKQSTGMNIQQRLVALHNLDAPWRPGDLEQRVGRIERQGNQFPEVYVCNYVTEGSFDGFIWQTLETKARFIQQMRSGDVTIREIDDISEVVLSAAEIKAIASGNPKVIRKVQLDAELIKLASLHSSYRDTQARMRTKLKNIAYTRERMHERRALLIATQEGISAYTGQDFTAALVKSLLTHEAIAYTKREAAGKALLALIAQAVAAAHAATKPIVRTIGTYNGLLLRVQAYPFGSSPEVFLALERDGLITPVSSTPIKCETPLGAFASTDSQIRGIAEALQRIDAEFAAMETEEAQIQVALTLPWEQAERYTQLRAELEALNAELSRQPDDTVEATTSEPACTDTGKLEIVAVSDADTVEVELPAQLAVHMPLLPPVALPEPSDLAAMAAAVAHLAALDTLLDETEEIEVEGVAAVEIEVEIEIGADIVQPALAVSVVALAVPQATPTFSVEPQDVILPKRTSNAAVSFGNLNHIKQLKATKPKPAKNASVELTADMFAAAVVVPLQMSLF